MTARDAPSLDELDRQAAGWPRGSRRAWAWLRGAALASETSWTVLAEIAELDRLRAARERRQELEERWGS